jgi:O-antigen ligase
MLAVLVLVLSLSLITFGAVPPTSARLLVVLWLFAAALGCALRVVKRSRLELSFIILVVAASVVSLLLPPKPAITLIAAVWAWAATSTSSDLRLVRFFRILVVIGVLEALLGLFQFFVSPGWIFGYVNPFYPTTGTLINPNHFAGLIEMLTPAAFGLAYIGYCRDRDLSRTYLYLLAIGLMGLAVVFSLARMGLFSLLATLCFLAVVLRYCSAHRKIGIALAVGAVALLAAGALWIGVDAIVQRYSALTGEDALFREGRLVVYGDAVRMIREHPFGVGVGNFQDVYRKYQTYRPDLLYDHAHNDYLEFAAEWGLPLAMAFWSLVLFVVVRNVRLLAIATSPEHRGILLACSGGIFSLLLHSMTDFNLQIPSNAMLFFALIGISLGMNSDRVRSFNSLAKNANR